MLNSVFKTAHSEFLIKKLLGKGKSGHSYLAENDSGKVVLKIMHDEPVAYYTFHDSKTKLEIGAYERLSKLNLKIPKLYEFDFDRQFLVKEFIDGTVASEFISLGKISDTAIGQMFEMSEKLKNENINIDYFPTNFVIRNDEIFYIDYETNSYLEEWNFLNWGIYYWANSEGMKRYLETGDSGAINEFPEKGIPHKREFENQVNLWKQKFNLATNSHQ